MEDSKDVMSVYKLVNKPCADWWTKEPSLVLWPLAIVVNL